MAIARDPFSVKSITKGHVSCADADYNMQYVRVNPASTGPDGNTADPD